jgi:hypothetical protein
VNWTEYFALTYDSVLYITACDIKITSYFSSGSRIYHTTITRTIVLLRVQGEQHVTNVTTTQEKDIRSTIPWQISGEACCRRVAYRVVECENVEVNRTKHSDVVGKCQQLSVAQKDEVNQEKDI